jgi:hypothetical protein
MKIFSVSTLLFSLAIILIPVDRFPFGMWVLREFGARPTNFILLVILIFLFVFFLKGRRIDSLNIRRIKLILLSILFLGLNSLVVIYLGGDQVNGRSPIFQWFLQYLIVIWFFVSLMLWISWLELIKPETDLGRQLLLKIFLAAAIVNLVIFFIDYLSANSDGLLELNSIAMEFLYSIRGKIDPRPSGLGSEPSVLGSWIAFIWPILLFGSSSLVNSGRKQFCYFCIAALLLAGILCGARTFLAIMLIQFLIFFVFLRKKSQLVNYLYLLIGAVMMVILFKVLNFENYYLTQLLSITNIENESTSNRLSSAIAAFRVSKDYPIFGVGIGQFTAYYPTYVPEWALSGTEAKSYISGNIDVRINTFNLPVRLLAELGYPTGSLIIGLVMLLCFNLISNIRCLLFDASLNADLKKFLVGITLSFFGGISWWLSQDLLSYQPGILALALGIWANRYCKKLKNKAEWRI